MGRLQEHRRRRDLDRCQLRPPGSPRFPIFQADPGSRNFCSRSGHSSNTATIYLVVASAVAGVASLGRIFQGTNGGASWVSSNTGLEGCTLFPSGPCTPSITGLKDTFVFSSAIDPICPTALHAGTVPGGVFRSINSGASWSSVNFTAASTDIEILATDPINSGTVYAVAKNDTIRRAPPPIGLLQGANSGVFKTTNGGQT